MLMRSTAHEVQLYAAARMINVLYSYAKVYKHAEQVFGCGMRNAHYFRNIFPSPGLTWYGTSIRFFFCPEK